MASFTRMMTVFLFVYGFELAYGFLGYLRSWKAKARNSRLISRMTISSSHPPKMGTELFRVISPLHTQ